MPSSRTPRHAAPAPSRRRTAMVPAVLLLSVGAALGGLAVLPSNAPAPISLTAASAQSPTVIAGQQQIVSNRRDLALLDGPTATPTRAPVRASRTRRIALPAPEFVRPAVGEVTSAYKWRWGRMHTGVDIAGPHGSPIRAVTGGTVTEAGWGGGYGLIVKIDHGDGLSTWYAHNSKLLVNEGDKVTAGEQIAKEGNTGNSTGPHLHFEVRVNDTPLNPIAWLAKHGLFY